MGASLAVLSAAAGAAPVTYHYDSGSFTSSPRAQTPRFGTHFTGDFTFSDDLIPGTLGFDYLNRVPTYGNPPGPYVLYQHATLLDWAVTSGEFTLNAANATITSDVYSFASASTGFVPLVYFSFEAGSNDIVPGGNLPITITGRPDLNITQGIGPYPGSTFSLRNFNLGGATLSKTAFAGGGGGGGGGGAGGGGAGTVPEPAAWSLMLLGFGLTGGMVRQRQRSAKIIHG